MATQVLQVVSAADSLVRRFGTRNPRELADNLGVTIMERDFSAQRGAYKVIMRQPFIFLKQDLHPVMKNIVIVHELGHHTLHREEASRAGGFSEFELFDMTGKRMEYEANIFAAQVTLPDEEVLDYISQGRDIEQIAKAMNSDINLVALKCDTLRHLGYPFRQQEHRSDFLRYDR